MAGPAAATEGREVEAAGWGSNTVAWVPDSVGTSWAFLSALSHTREHVLPRKSLCYIGFSVPPNLTESYLIYFVLDIS